MTAPLCFVDTETDGVHPDRKPWEIALIRCEPNGRQTRWADFVEIDLATADPFGLRIGRFYDRHPLGRFIARGNLGDPPHPPRAIPADEAAMRVAQMTHGAYLVGIVPDFDARTLAELLRAHGLAPSWDHHLIDVRGLAVGYLRGRGEKVDPTATTVELLEAVGVRTPPEEEKHTALGDALWAGRAYDKIMGIGAS